MDVLLISLSATIFVAGAGTVLLLFTTSTRGAERPDGSRDQLQDRGGLPRT